MADDLRARIAEALCPPHHRVGVVSSGQPLVPLSPCQLHQAQAGTVLAVVQPKLDRLNKRIEDYRASRKRWMEAAYADRRCSVEAAAERDTLRVELDELLDRLDDDTVGPDSNVAALLEHLAELLPDADPAADMEHYLRQARVGHHRALRARDRCLAAEAQLAEVRRFCELSKDSMRVPVREFAQDVLRYLDTGHWKEPS